MPTRRRFLGYSAMTSALLACRPLLRFGIGQAQQVSQAPLRLAIIGNAYTYGSELQGIADCFLVGYPTNGTWHIPNVQVVSMYIQPAAEQGIQPAAEPAPGESVPTGVPSSSLEPRGAGGRGAGGRGAGGRGTAAVGATGDRRPPVAQSAQAGRGAVVRPPAALPPTGPGSDLSRARSDEFGFRLCANIPEALRCGGDHLAVDAILSVVEQVNYPRNDRGQILYPRYDFFQQCAQVFEDEGHALPYFNHKSLACGFREAQNMVTTAERLKFPMLAGASLPLTMRLPDIDVPLGGAVQEAVMVGVGSFDGMDFDALEAMQCMLERRKGGETGVKSVQLLEGDDVWAAGDAGRWSKDLLSSALSRTDSPLGLTNVDGRTQDLSAPGVLQQLAVDPAAYCIEYNDGTRATLFMLNGAVLSYTCAVRMAGQSTVSTEFVNFPPPDENYSACLAAKIEQLYLTGSAPYPVRRTLLTSGVLEACLTSKARMNQRLETPHLAVSYKPPAESQYRRT